MIRSRYNEKFLYKYSRAGHYKIAVCYPNSYFIGMSNLGFLSLFHSLSSVDGIEVYRCFIERNEILFSPEKNYQAGHCNLSNYDAIFFSVSFELDYLNIVKMLTLSGINPKMEERKELDPIIIGGGITITSNPLPLSVIFDAVYLGDMEVGLEQLVETLFRNKFKRNNILLKDISNLSGFYVKNFNISIPDKAVEKRIKRAAHSVVITGNTVFANRFLVEVARGCKNSCRFCMTRTSNFPPRKVQEDAILEVAERAKEYTHAVGLIAPVVNDNDALLKIVEKLNRKGMLVSFSSLRADKFTEELAKFISLNKQRTITFAPETGSERLRRSIGKILTNDRLLKSVELSLKYGIKKIRYYFMYGLPDENWDDIKSIFELTYNTLNLIGDDGSLHLSINPFIPKKNTPFQNEEIKDEEYYIEVKNFLKQNFFKMKNNKNISIRFESLKFIHSHYYFSLGGEKTGYFLSGLSYLDGARKIERHFKKLFTRGIKPDKY